VQQEKCILNKYLLQPLYQQLHVPGKLEIRLYRYDKSEGMIETWKTKPTIVVLILRKVGALRPLFCLIINDLGSAREQLGNQKHFFSLFL